MFPLKTILMPTDFSRCAHQALDYAVDLTERTGASLHLLHVHVLPGQTTDDPEFTVSTREDDLVQAAASRAEELQEHPMPAQIDVVRVERRGLSIALEILAYASEVDADLVVMGTHGRRGLGQLFLGSVAEEVARHARCPVLTVKERRHARPLKDMHRVLVPVDFSETSGRAVAKARHFAAETGATIHLLHVIDRPLAPPVYGSAAESLLRADAELVARCRAEMGRMAESAAGPAVPIELHLREGAAAAEICDFAENEDIDLVVIGSHGLSGLQRFLLGSVAERVVRWAPCPVFTVKSFGKSVLSDAGNRDRNEDA